MWLGLREEADVQEEAMYRKILVPLDGSTLAAAVLPYVRQLAGALGLPVELLSVSDPGQLVAYAPDVLRELSLEAAKSFPESIDVSHTLESGDPANRIVEKAQAESGTLVAMSTHGYSGAARWLLGSVAEKVSDRLASDLFLLRPGQADMGGEINLRTVLVPLDFSAAAELTLPVVAELAPLLKLEILLVHATKRFYPGPPETFTPTFGAIPNLKELWERDTAESERYLKEKARELQSRGIRVNTRSLAGGVDGAAGEIVDLAQKVPDSLIVMTPHGQSGVGRWLMGSVTKRVIQYSRRPVLVVRAPRDARASAA
jgi:nucleotide-binding universal stress UspA family protein